MVNIFDRSELITTFDMAEQARVREILAANGVEYSVKTINRKSPSPFSAGSRARTGTLGERLEMECQYVIYVKRADCQWAAELIKKPGGSK